jgi:hypothetical protein
MTKSIIYYSGNREKPEMEQKIIDDMLSKAGDMPIISVTQKPMNLGQNVCIGDVGFSYLNERKQILMACKLATTDYVITTESDFLYPPEYFDFEPTGDNVYRYYNIWIMWLNDAKRKNFYRKTAPSDGAQIVKREFFIELLEEYLKPYPGWYVKNNKRTDPYHSPYHHVRRENIGGDVPCVSIKSDSGLTYLTGVYNEPETTKEELPYWGNVDDLRRRFL